MFEKGRERNVSLADHRAVITGFEGDIIAVPLTVSEGKYNLIEMVREAGIYRTVGEKWLLPLDAIRTELDGLPCRGV